MDVMEKSPVVQEKENTLENVEAEIIAPTEPNDADVLEVSITEMDSNSDDSHEKETVEEKASQSAENSGQINMGPDDETNTTTIKDDKSNGDAEETSEEIVKKILSNEKINEEDLISYTNILSTIEKNLVDLIVENCGFDESKSISYCEMNRLKRMITDSFPKVNIDEVQKLSNKYLYAAFMLKKTQKQHYKILEMIHSTAAENVPSIQEDNLDWRRVCRAKYGYGVSFSCNADYANYHSSWSGGCRRAFIICDVLVGSIENVYDNDNDAPDGDIDTFQSSNSYVHVKFEDFSFYLKYALYYDKPSDSVSCFCRRRW